MCSGFLAECLVVGLEDVWAFLPVPCCLSSVRLHTCGIDSSARSMDALPLAILHPYISWTVSLSELLGFRVAPRYAASLLFNLMFLPFRSTDFAGCCCLVVVVQQHASVSQGCCLLFLFIGCLTSQQHASVSQGRICSDNFTCCHTEIEAADETFHLTQSQYTDTGPTSPSTDPIAPGAWQGIHWSANF